MEAAEYADLDAMEGAHWYYRGKRRLARYWIKSAKKPQTDDLVLDVGCGTGRFLGEWTETRVLGADAFPPSIDIARRRLPGRLLQATLPDLPLADKSVDVVTGLDVLEHCADDRAAFREIARVLKPGGVVFLTVPALKILWSDWDVSLHHYRRYTRRMLLEAVPAGFTVERCAYFNDVGFFPILLIRTLQNIFHPNPDARMESRPMPGFLNSLLEKIFVWTATRRFYRAPLGVSLFLLAKKETQA